MSRPKFRFTHVVPVPDPTTVDASVTLATPRPNTTRVVLPDGYSVTLFGCTETPKAVLVRNALDLQARGYPSETT